MKKPADKHPQQLQLRVFSQIDGGLSNRTTKCPIESTSHVPQTDLQRASAEDRAVYQAIADRYFKSVK